MFFELHRAVSKLFGDWGGVNELEDYYVKAEEPENMHLDPLYCGARH